MARRDALTEEEREKYSDQIAERLFAREEYKRAKVVLSYASYKSEVITDRINRQVIQDGKALFLPKTEMEKHEMIFYRVSDLDTDLKPGTMGIREPVGGEAWGEASGNGTCDCGVNEEATTLVLVPGVAFDANGNRMGYGGGFYDRLFAEHPELIDRGIFLAYEVQRAENLPSEPTDRRVKSVLTEQDFYDIII